MSSATGEVAIIDPGPDRKEHVGALLEALRGETIAAILVTHTHRDHSPAARALKAATGAPILGCAPYAPADKESRRSAPDGPHDLAYAPDSILREGEAFEAQGLRPRLRRDARPHGEPSRFRPAAGKGAVFGRPRHGLVDLASRRRRTARCAITWPRSKSCASATTASIGRDMAVRFSSRSVTCARSPITAASANAPFYRASRQATERSRRSSPMSMKVCPRPCAPPRASPCWRICRTWRSAASSPRTAPRRSARRYRLA